MKDANGVTVALVVSTAGATEAFRKAAETFNRFAKAVANAFVPMSELYALEGIKSPEEARRTAASILNDGPSRRQR